MTMTDDGDHAWHLDRKVPLAMIFTLVMQTALGVWWAAGLSATVAQVAGVNDAQDVEAALIAEGLDPAMYGFWCEDALDAGGTRQGIRYDELQAFLRACGV